MIFFKLLYHLCSIIKIVFYKLIFREHILIPYTVSFRKGCTILVSNDGKLFLGNNVFLNNYSSIVCCNLIKIGDNTIIGENVKIYDHNHVYRRADVPVKDQGFTSSPIQIGDNCWLANNVVVLKGVTIGNHCVIGAGCIVYKNVPDNSILLSDGTIKPIE